MALIDWIKDSVERVLPARSAALPSTMSGGIGSGHGMVPFEDDMIVSKPTILFHSSQVFFNFLAMACYASVASFQAHWGVGPSPLSGFAVLVSVCSIVLSLFVLLVPVVYEKYDKFVRLARALREIRVGFILTGAGATFNFLVAFIVTISAWTEAGCKNAANDPNASKGSEYRASLPGWCSTKRAGAVFSWVALIFWVLLLGLHVRDWRDGKHDGPRDPPFTRPPTDHVPIAEDEGDEESTYRRVSPARRNPPDNSDATNSPFADTHRHAVPASRPSMDAYGAFSDPAPSGYGISHQPPVLPEVDQSPLVSRTMQYADPYAAVRAQIAAGHSPVGSPPPPPSYESYQGYQ